jgi:cellulose biosynthesis protein BcsQ
MSIARTALSRVIAFINGKGGVGKTTLAANVAGLVAGSGAHVLVVDADPQGNLARDLGYLGSPGDDEGRALSAALTYSLPIEPLRNVRENLDVLVGGKMLKAADAALTAASVEGDPREALARVLEPLAGDYDMILLDAPPGAEALQKAVLGAARWVVIPAKTDGASADGLSVVAERLESILDINPDIEVLGIPLFGVGATATAIAAKARTELAAIVGDNTLLFDQAIRHAEAVAQDARAHGRLVHELEETAATQPKWYQLRRGEATAETLVSGTSGNVASDLQALTTEIVTRLQTREGTTP